MFVDQVRIRVIAGRGGDGCVSFRREKYVPFGGPDGGDGGKGGDVIFVADAQLSSLLDLRYHSQWKGKRGVHGMGSGCHGKNGEDISVRIPPGTVVRDFNTGEVLCDLVEDGQQFIAGKGGRGGKGNARFATSRDKAPKFAEKGEPGEEREYQLELKVIADVGLVGFPNAGKSTLLSAVTKANPKIADYPFTTLSPNLGVATLSDYRTLLIADIPGIIEGAAEGKGLGHDFLRHIERTKVLLIMVDLGDEDPIATRDAVEKELAEYSDALAERPRLYALTKSDVTENRERFEEVAGQFDKPFLISGVTGDGMPDLLEALWDKVEEVKRLEAAIEPDPEPEKEYTYRAPYTITPIPEGFRIEGKTILRAVRMTDFDNEDAVRHLQKRFHKMGLLKALKRLGAEEGQSIFIGDVELEYQPE